MPPIGFEVRGAHQSPYTPLVGRDSLRRPDGQRRTTRSKSFRITRKREDSRAIEAPAVFILGRFPAGTEELRRSTL